MARRRGVDRIGGGVSLAGDNGSSSPLALVTACRLRSFAVCCLLLRQRRRRRGIMLLSVVYYSRRALADSCINAVSRAIVGDAYTACVAGDMTYDYLRVMLTCRAVTSSQRL